MTLHIDEVDIWLEYRCDMTRQRMQNTNTNTDRMQNTNTNMDMMK